MTEVGRGGGVDPLAALITRDATIELDMVTRGRRRTPAPAEVTAALVGAAREAVRNVERHAGVQRATVVVLRGRRHLGVDVVDQGVGPGSHVGFGVASSIVGRMDAVGGSAELAVAPGGGTHVRLRWAAPASPGSPASTYRVTVAALGGDAPVIAMMAFLGLGALTLCGLYVTANDRVVPQAAAAVALTVSMVATVTLRRWVMVRWWRVAALTVGCAALAWFQVWTADAGALLDFRSWGVGFAMVPLYAAAFYAPARAYPLLAGPTVFVLVALVVHDPSLRSTALTGAFSAPVLVVFPSLVGALVRRSGRIADEQRRRLTTAAAAIARDAALEASMAEHLGFAREQVLPWLERVERGELDHRDPEVRVAARRLMERARDDLDAPDFFDDALRRRVQTFRGRGGRLRIRPGVLSGAGEREAGAVLTWLTDHAPSQARIVLTPAEDGSARVVVTPGLPTEVARELEAEGRAEVTGDGFATAIVVPVPPQ